MELVLSTDGGEVKVPFEILQHLQPHQIDGIRFMYDNTIGSVLKAQRNEEQRGCVLAHCMGLGKTLQVVALTATVLANPQLEIKHILCIVPVNVLRNWDNEYLKWTPNVPVFTVGGETGNVNKKRVETLEKWETAENGAVLLIGYDTFRNLVKGAKIKKAEWKEVFQRVLLKVPDFVVCDEGHMMKNADSGMSQAVSQLEARRRVVLTGTPLQNNLMEYWTMVNFVRPGLLGTAKEFKEKFEGPIQNGQHADSERSEVVLMKKRTHILNGLLNQMIHRRGYDVLAQYLPRKHEYIVSVRLSALQIALYKRYIAMNAASKNNKGLFKAFSNLSQLSAHPGILELKERPAADREKHGYASIDDFVVESEEEDWSDSAVKKGGNVKGKAKKGKPTKKAAKKAALQASAVEQVVIPEDGEDVLFNGEKWWGEALDHVDHLDPELSGKVMILLEILQHAAVHKEKVLVFTQSLKVLELIEQILSEAKSPRGHERSRETLAAQGSHG